MPVLGETEHLSLGDVDEDALHDACEGLERIYRHGLLGMSRDVQGPVLDEIAYWFDEGFPASREDFSEAELAGEGWLLLGQFESTGELMFGDARRAVPRHPPRRSRGPVLRPGPRDHAVQLSCGYSPPSRASSSHSWSCATSSCSPKSAPARADRRLSPRAPAPPRACSLSLIGSPIGRAAERTRRPRDEARTSELRRARGDRDAAHGQRDRQRDARAEHRRQRAAAPAGRPRT